MTNHDNYQIHEFLLGRYSGSVEVGLPYDGEYLHLGVNGRRVMLDAAKLDALRAILDDAASRMTKPDVAGEGS